MQNAQGKWKREPTKCGWTIYIHTNRPSRYSKAITRRRVERDREVSRFCVILRVLHYGVFPSFRLRSPFDFVVAFFCFHSFSTVGSVVYCRRRRCSRRCCCWFHSLAVVVVAIVSLFFLRIVLPSCICGYFSLLIILHPPDRQTEYTQ